VGVCLLPLWNSLCVEGICFDNIFVVLMRGEVDFVCSLCGALCSLLSVWFEYFVVCVVRVFWSFVFL
jgi:hypothetical protein